MPFASRALALAVLASGTAQAQPSGEPVMTALVPPETRQGDVVEEHFGVEVADPFRWLEGDARSDAEVAAWVEAQNAATEGHLRTLPSREVFTERLRALMDVEQVSAPRRRGDRFFFTRNPGTASQPRLMVREDGEDRVLIDPAAWSQDGADALAEWAPSDDGRLVAYAVQEGGTDWRTIRVLDVETGEVRPDQVEWARFTLLDWAEDGSGFFYSRFAAPEGGVPSSAPVAGHSVHFHALGTPQSQDRLVYATPDRPELLHLAEVTEDGRHLLITSTPGPGATGLTAIDLGSDDWVPRTLVEGLEHEWILVGHEGSRLLFVTTGGAERRRIVALDLAEADPEPVEVVPEDAAVLVQARLIGGRLLATYLVDARSEVRRFRPDGTPDGTVELPGIGSAGGFEGEADDPEAFYVFTSFDAPTTIVRYDVEANASTVWAEPEVTADLDALVVEQLFFASADGTRVPMFVVRRRDVTGPAPTLLYGYGGFGISMVPFYSPPWLAWVEQGGVLAVANIRGGGEYGRAWHEAARLGNRQTAFDDFIAAAEFLKAEGIAAEDGLAIQGESNGGLLVGAVTNQRPDLFAAALPGVGVMDMLRYPLFTGGGLWVSEFGHPAEERHFRNLLSYSPYHNVRPGADYPAILATTAEADDRVPPGHSFKYVAALQAADIGPMPHLVRIETRAGHGAGMPQGKVVALYADLWAFAAHWTSLEVGRPARGTDAP